MKNKLKKRILITLLLVIILFAIKFLSGNGDNFRAINMVPKNAFLILESDDPYNAWKQLDESIIWKHMQTNNFFNEINTELYSIDSLMKKNKLLFRLFGSRKVLISVHYKKPDKYETLIVADLKSLTKLSLVKNQLTKLNNDSYSVTKRDYKKHEIFEVYDRTYKEMIYLCLYKNLVILTYDHLLLEKSLAQVDLPELSRNEELIDVTNQIRNSGQIRFLVNFKEILKLFEFKNESNSINSFINQLQYGALKLNIEEDYLSLDGYINNKDSIPNIINALKKSKTGGHSISKHISQRAFLFTHLSFSSFQELINNLEENLKLNGLYEEYSKNKRKIERYIDIDINENIVSWIGNEIGILNTKSKYKEISDEYILVIKTNSEKEAKKQLSFINNQVKKHTPVKFTTINYKNTDINYLSASGLFKMFFGKYFSKLDKPYYMVYDKHVYFGNHPQTLKDIIDDLDSEKTLYNWVDYKSFYENQMNNDANISVFINLPVLLNEKKEAQLIDYKKTINANINFIEKIPFIAFQIEGNNSFFYTHLCFQYKDTLVVNKQQSQTNLPENYYIPQPVFISDSNSENNKFQLSKENIDPFEVPDLAILDLTKGEFKSYYPDSSIKIIADINGGIKHGYFVWYHDNGEIKLKGKFKNGQKSGTWKYYSERGTLIEKRRFE